MHSNLGESIMKNSSEQSIMTIIKQKQNWETVM